jgi:predicted DsbA family dithiol-disulfide isomerase
MGHPWDNTKKFAKKYSVHLGILLLLLLGFIHRKKLGKDRLEAKESVSEGGKKTQTVLLNKNLYGKSIEEKRRYLLNNFDMDCLIGDSGAKITIVDHSSFNCKYCKKIRPEIRKIIQEYVIDKKVARYALRPLYGVKNLPIGAFLQCSRPEDRLKIAEELFGQDVSSVDNFTQFLTELGKKYGMDEEYVKECIHNEDLYRKIIYMQQNSREAFNINVTPLLVINNQEKIGYKSYEQIRDIIEGFLMEEQR